MLLGHIKPNWTLRGDNYQYDTQQFNALALSDVVTRSGVRFPKDDNYYGVVACKEAWPHKDVAFKDKIILSIVLQADHLLGDQDYHEEQWITPGAVTVIDANKIHWLKQGRFGTTGPYPPYIAVLYTFDASRSDLAAAMVKSLGNSFSLNRDIKPLRGTLFRKVFECFT
jgi:hypothetical protein